MVRLIAALMDPQPRRHVQIASAAAVAFSVTSLTLACIYAWIRADLGGPSPLALAKATALSTSIMALWIVLVTIIRERFPGMLSVAALLTFVAMLIGPGLALSAIGGWLLAALSLVILGLASFPVRATLRLLPGWLTVALVVMGSLAGMSLFMAQNSYTYSHVFGPEMALTGGQHGDPLFHAAIAEMLVQYSKMTTALDGIVVVPYHVLSHLWLGLTGRALGVSTIEAYMIGPPLIGVPLLLFALSVAAAHALPNGLDEQRSDFLVIPAAIATLFVIEIWDYGAYVASESYLFAMIGAFFGFAALADLFRGDVPLSNRGVIGRNLTLVILTFLLMGGKLSVGVIFACGAFYAVFRWHGMPFKRALFWGAMLGALGLLFIWSTSSSSHTEFSELDPLHIFRAYPDIAWINFSVCLSGLLLAMALWPFASKEDRPRLETLAVIVVAAMIPTALLRIGGGSGYYFVHVGTFAVMLLAARLLVSLQPNRPALVLASTLIFVSAVPAAHMLSDRKRTAWTTVESRALRLVQLLGAESGRYVRQRTASWWQQPIAPFRNVDFGMALKDSLGAKLLSARALVPNEWRSRTIVHIPDSNQVFWKANTVCRNTPMNIPALLGMPLLKGLPPVINNCDLSHFYGYPEYRQLDSAARTLDAKTACALAKERGYSAVLSIPEPEKPQLIRCD